VAYCTVILSFLKRERFHYSSQGVTYHSALQPYHVSARFHESFRSIYERFALFMTRKGQKVFIPVKFLFHFKNLNGYEF
jgi:hypothetical protein